MASAIWLWLAWRYFLFCSELQRFATRLESKWPGVPNFVAVVRLRTIV